MPQLILPPNTPRLSSSELRQRIEQFNIDRTVFPLIVVGIRGYYKTSMGNPENNDRGIYDDAIFIDTMNSTISYNANTDPYKVKKGQGFGNQKGMASLKAGCYFVHRWDKHNGNYFALCQREGVVTVIRDGNPDYEHTGNFGINIHKGGFNTTSSLGCQTIYPEQWGWFIKTIKVELQRFFPIDWKTKIVPYILLEE
jgi:lysozyme